MEEAQNSNETGKKTSQEIKKKPLRFLISCLNGVTEEDLTVWEVLD